MFNTKTVLAIIPARGGSKGIPRKNIRDLAGKPLIAWTIEAARKSKYIDRLILSSEDDEIMNIAAQWGCEVPFKRPVNLAQDDTPGVEPVIHALQTLPEHYDYVILLQPTSPLRTVEDIDHSIEYCIERNASTCVSLSEAKKTPYWMYELDKQGVMLPVLHSDRVFNRRQELKPVFLLNGAIYIAKTDHLLSERTFLGQGTIGYIMPGKRSFDIDEEMDFLICEFILGR